MQTKNGNTIICSVCKEKTNSEDYTPQYCSNCGHKFVAVYPIRKATNKEKQCSRYCFDCMHYKGKGLDSHCDLKKEKIMWAFDYICNNFTRAEWSKEVIEELMSMPRR